MFWTLRAQVDQLFAKVETELVLAQIQITEWRNREAFDQWMWHVVFLRISSLELRHHVNARLNHPIWIREVKRVLCWNRRDQRSNQLYGLFWLEVLA